MQKGILLVPRNAAREILSPDDAIRMLASRSWVEVKEPVKANAIKQRQFRRKRKLLGLKRFTAYLSPELFALLNAVKLPGEGNSELLTRLLCSDVLQGQLDANN